MALQTDNQHLGHRTWIVATVLMVFHWFCGGCVTYYKCNDIVTATMTGDSLAIKAHLSDTLWAVSAVSHYCNRYAELYPVRERSASRDSLASVPVPRVSVTLHNRSKRNLLVPLADLGLVPFRSDDNWPVLQYQVGTYTESAAAVDLTRNRTKAVATGLATTDHFVKLNPGGSLNLADTTNAYLFSLDDSWHEGRYWLVVWYQNCWSKGHNHSYWLGKTHSDTLWFRISD